MFSLLPSELNILILSFIDNDNIQWLRLINKNTNEFIKNPMLWKFKIYNLYKDFIIPNEVKNDYKKCYNLCDILYDDDDIHSNLLDYTYKYEYVDIILWLIKCNKSIFEKGANILAKYGKLKELQYLGFCRPDANGAYMALKNQHYNVVYWLIDNINLYPLMFNLISYCKINELQLLMDYDKHKFIKLLNNNKFIYCGPYKFYEWLKSYDICLLSRQNLLNNFIDSNNLEGIKWCIANGQYPNHNIGIKALYKGHIIIYDWLVKNNYINDNYENNILTHDLKYIIFKQALNNKLYNDINLIIQRYEITLTTKELNDQILNIYSSTHIIKILEIYKNYKYNFEQSSANKAVEYAVITGDISILEWLFINCNILLTVKHIDMIVNEKNKYIIKILEWLFIHNIYSNHRVISNKYVNRWILHKRKIGILND